MGKKTYILYEKVQKRKLDEANTQDLNSKKNANDNKFTIPLKGLEKVKTVFDSMDEGEKGYVSLPELKKGLAGSFSTKECEEIFKRELKKRKFYNEIKPTLLANESQNGQLKKQDMFYIDNIPETFQPDSKLELKDFVRMIQPPDFDVNWDVLDRTIVEELIPQYRYPKEVKKLNPSKDQSTQDRVKTQTSLENN